MFYDSTYLLILVGALLSFLASSMVKNRFAQYSKVRSRAGLTGAQVAQELLHSQGIYDVSVQPIEGSLTDHYDPSQKVLRLSQPVYYSSSIAAIGVAAHECGHAVQHDRGYVPLAIRTAIVPVANFGAKFSWPLFLIGLFLGGDISFFFLEGGILLFLAALAFQLVTLPVEFDASARALRLLESERFLASDEVGMARKVLTAAAMTYVASVAASLLQLLRLLMLANRRRR